MTCDEAQELITALADGELAPGERSAVESHLAGCAACQATHALELDLKKQTRAAARALNAPADLKQKLSTLVDYASTYTPTQRRTPAHWWSTPRWRLAFASMALVLFVLPFLYFGEVPNTSVITSTVFETHRKVLAG